MHRLRQELRVMGGLFAKNPGLLFAALLVLGLAISTGVESVAGNDLLLAGTMHASRAIRVSHLDAVWHGARADRGLLRVVALPWPSKKASTPAKPAAPPAKASGGGSGRVSCSSLSDLRFPEFNLLTPLL